MTLAHGSINRRSLLTWGGAGLAGTLLSSGIALPAHAADYSGFRSAKSDWGSPVWSDEFSGNTLSSSKWNVSHNTFRPDWGWLRSSNVEVRDGLLRLKAQRLSKPVRTPDGRTRSWSSAEVSTKGKFSMEYGRWEVTARTPNSPGNSVGLWSGVWLHPDNGWLGGEIDIFETYGSKTGQAKTNFDQTDRAEASFHFNQQRHGSLRGWTPDGQNTSSSFHTWAMERTPQGVTVFFEGQSILHVPSSAPNYYQAFPKGTKMNLRANMQIGNTYWGLPTSSTQSNPALEIKSIRCYQY